MYIYTYYTIGVGTNSFWGEGGGARAQNLCLLVGILFRERSLCWRVKCWGGGGGGGGGGTCPPVPPPPPPPPVPTHTHMQMHACTITCYGNFFSLSLIPLEKQSWPCPVGSPSLLSEDLSCVPGEVYWWCSCTCGHRDGWTGTLAESQVCIVFVHLYIILLYPNEWPTTMRSNDTLVDTPFSTN